MRKNLSPLENDAGWAIDRDIYIIAVRPLNTLEKVPMVITTTTPTNINFKLAGLQDFPGKIYLYDSKTKIYYPLKDQEITFSLADG